MDTETILYLSFKTLDDRTKTISVYSPDENLEHAQIAAAMDEMIAAQIFEDKLQSKDSARYVTKTIEPVSLV